MVATPLFHVSPDSLLEAKLLMLKLKRLLQLMAVYYSIELDGPSPPTSLQLQKSFLILVYFQNKLLQLTAQAEVVFQNSHDNASVDE